MLPVAWLVAAVLAAILLTTWVTFTVTRLERLHGRLDAAQAALDAQLVRRAAALLRLAESPELPLPDETRTRLASAARDALRAADGTDDGPGSREAAENAVGRAVAELAGQLVPRQVDAQVPAAAASAAAELQETATRVLIARRFYNDAVRDTRSLRDQRLARLLRRTAAAGPPSVSARASGDRARPQFFDIDDTLPAGVPAAYPAPRPVRPPDTVPMPLAAPPIPSTTGDTTR